MLKSFFKSTFRSLWKNKGYGFLNIAGLGIGITCAALIFLWVEDEMSYDHNFAKRDHLYQVLENQPFEGKISTVRATSGPMAAALKAEVPGIKNAARLSFDPDHSELFSLGDKSINEQGYYADSAIFSMLTLPFVYGSAVNAFRQLHSVVISEKMSRKYFGSADPVGKVLHVNKEQDYTVTGVFKTLPENSTFQFQWLAPFELFEAHQAWLKGWGNNGVHTVVELQPAANVRTVNAKLAEFLGTKQKNMASVQCFLFSMNDWHLHNDFIDGKMAGGEIKYVKLFSVIAWIILLIGCINFMNLATARSEQRAKEVGVRKVMGAGKGGLISQFGGEALIMSYLSILLAVLIIVLTLPGFNSLVGKQLALNLYKPLHLFGLLTIGAFCGLTAGSYPAFYLSSFNPVMVLKGMKLKTNAGVIFMRKGLVVMQFTVSIVLIISTVIIYQQITHVQERTLGYDKNNLIYVSLQGALKDHFEGVRNDLISTGSIENAALSADPLLLVGTSSDSPDWQGKEPNKHISISIENVSQQYLATMGMTLTKGRSFYSVPKADSGKVIINEAFAAQMGKAGRIGGIITSWGQQFTIVGIVKDYVFNDMYATSEPLMLFNTPSAASFLTIRFKKNVDLSKAIAQTENILKASNPGYPFEYTFVDDDFNRLFKTESLIEKLAGVFALLAIFISCLGLFGLSAYMAERRTREIGIRKVLGAPVAAITALLSKDFMKLVLIATFIAFPVAWWAMNSWLQNYAYRVSISVWVFIITGISAIFIALVTLSFQTIKAAVANPVKSLRME